MILRYERAVSVKPVNSGVNGIINNIIAPDTKPLISANLHTLDA